MQTILNNDMVMLYKGWTMDQVIKAVKSMKN